MADNKLNENALNENDLENVAGGKMGGDWRNDQARGAARDRAGRVRETKNTKNLKNLKNTKNQM